MSSSSSKKRRKSSSSSSTINDTGDGAHLLQEPPSSIFPSNLDDFLRFLAVLSIATLVALACNFAFVHRRRPMAPTPFCDTTADDWDFCLPCPDHGECSGGELRGCVFGYKKIGRSCVEDGQFNWTAKKFADWTERYVCEARAIFLCQGTGTVWLRESDVLKLLEELKTKENFALDDAAFLLIKQLVLRTIEGSLETRVVHDGVKEFMCPDQLVILYKPFLCSLKHWIYEHVLLLSSISAMICEILEENSMMSEISEPSDVKIQPWMVYSWLRDHLLLPRERKHTELWKKVEELVQQDSRIDQYPKLIKGESRIVLEWQVKGSLSAKMRKRGKEATTQLKSSEAHVDHFGRQDKHRPELLLNS